MMIGRRCSLQYEAADKSSNSANKRRLRRWAVQNGEESTAICAEFTGLGVIRKNTNESVCYIRESTVVSNIAMDLSCKFEVAVWSHVSFCPISGPGVLSNDGG
jgi:hypothetical protein